MISSKRRRPPATVPVRLMAFLLAAVLQGARPPAIMGQELPPVDVEGQPLAANVKRLVDALTLAVQELPTLGGSVRTTQLRRELIAAAIDCGGSFAIHRTPEATREQVEACYPQLKALLAEKRRSDPEGKISTPWYRHHRSLLGREACAVRWNRQRPSQVPLGSPQVPEYTTCTLSGLSQAPSSASSRSSGFTRQDSPSATRQAAVPFWYSTTTVQAPCPAAR